MSSSADLWELIQSLSKTEKRYFRRHSSVWSDDSETSYLRLFDLLSTQHQYDPAGILQEINDPAFEKRYSAHKHYLYNVICRVMRSYHAESAASQRIQGWLADASFLFRKTLFEQAYKVLQKAWKPAADLELFATMLEILRWEKRILKRIRSKDRTQLLEEVNHRLARTLHQLQEEQEFDELYEKVYGFSQAGHEGKAGMDTLIDHHPLMQGEQLPGSFRAQHFYYQVLIFRAQLHGDLGGAMKWQSKQLDLWQGHTLIQEEEPHRYSVVMANYLGIAAAVPLKAEYERVRPLLAKLEVSSPLDQFQIELQLYHLDLLFWLNQRDYDAAIKGMPAVTWLERNREKLHASRLMAFFYNLAFVEFMGGNYRASMKWVRQHAADGRQAERQDVQAAMQMLLFIMYYEMNEPDLMESQYRSLTRFLNLYSDHLFPGYMVPQLQRIFRMMPGKKQTQAFAVLAGQLNQHPDCEAWKAFAGYGDFSQWLLSKASACTP
jgi:hypothetical protein